MFQIVSDRSLDSLEFIDMRSEQIRVDQSRSDGEENSNCKEMRSQVTAESDVDTVFVSVRNAFDKLALKDANVVFVLGEHCNTHTHTVACRLYSLLVFAQLLRTAPAPHCALCIERVLVSLRVHE